MISSTQQLRLPSETEKRPSIRQLCTQLSRNRCISWTLSVVLAVTTIGLLLLCRQRFDVVQAAFCVHLVAFCVTCAVLAWTKDSWNVFGMSVGFPVLHFFTLSFIIWDCEPLFFVVKLVLISCLWFATRLMRITSARLVYASTRKFASASQKPKPRVQVTTVQYLIGASVALVASLHLAYPEHEAFSFAEMALWGCFIVDVLWHFGIWKMTMKQMFRGVKEMRKSLFRRNSKLIMIEGVQRRINIATAAGVLFAEIGGCALMIFANSALDLLLQDKSNLCKIRNSVGSHRVSAFAFPIFLAMHIACWVLIHSHVLKKRWDKKRQNGKENRQVLQRLYVDAPQQVVVLPHRGPNSGLAETNKASEREMKCHTSSSPFVLPPSTHEKLLLSFKIIVWWKCVMRLRLVHLPS
jgi:hypothetical protein